MHIEKVVIENFKCFKGKFTIAFNEGLNIIVGDNESGKSSVLEAIHLALTGILNGRYLKNELTQYLFNNEVCEEYFVAFTDGKPKFPPALLIEVFIADEECPLLIGDANSDKKKACGVSLKICFDNKYQQEYEELIKKGDIKSLPIEYYDIDWKSFARESLTARSIPLKSALIDSSSNRYQNGSDIYISRIIREHLEPSEIADVSQAFRRIKETFMEDEAIQTINEKIRTSAKISEKEVKLSVDLSSRNTWEGSLTTLLDEIPFHHVGKGEQCIVKTKLALSHKKSQEANLILLEEPENHLSHTNLSKLLRDIKENCEGKQILVSTHNSFVANKLGLDNLILLHDQKTIMLNDLAPDTRSFFQKLAGYDTLRLILCSKAILVEGDSDELVVQKAYMLQNRNKLPIEDGVDVISVGTSFLRFLEIAEKIKKPVVVITDNDGDVEALKKKYQNFLGENAKKSLCICFDETVDTGDLEIGKKKFNYNTLEPKMLKANGLQKMNAIIGTKFKDESDMHKHMHSNKTECALKVFDTTEQINFPDYISNAIE